MKDWNFQFVHWLWKCQLPICGNPKCRMTQCILNWQCKFTVILWLNLTLIYPNISMTYVTWPNTTKLSPCDGREQVQYYKSASHYYNMWVGNMSIYTYLFWIYVIHQFLFRQTGIRHGKETTNFFLKLGRLLNKISSGLSFMYIGV
jgi:hypothetical protein